MVGCFSLSCQLYSVVVPQIESVCSGLAVVSGVHFVAARFEENAGLGMDMQESLRLSGRLETPMIFSRLRVGLCDPAARLLRPLCAR